MSQQQPYDDEKARQFQNLLGYSPEGGAVQPQNTNTEAAPAPAPEGDTEDKAPNKSANGEKFLRALWTIASVISMTVTLVVLVLVVLSYRYIKLFPIAEIIALGQQKGEELPPDLNIEQVAAITEDTVVNFPPEVGLNTPLDLLQGLYDNFEKMDNAHIETTILVEDEIPVQFTLGLNQDTTVVLSEAVTIPGARVALTTGGLNIFNAPATVVLPAGTELPITLALEVPVDEMIPIALNVPVDIALDETDLHEPFVGLQDVVRPLYCLVKSDATNSLGIALCPEGTTLEE